MGLLGSLLILVILLLGIGAFAEQIVTTFFGLCPKCDRHGVHTTVEDTGPDSSYPNTNHFFIREACRCCGWNRGRDVNSRPDRWSFPPNADER